MDSSIIYFSSKEKIGLSGIISLLFPLLILQTFLFFVADYIANIFFHHHFFKINSNAPGAVWAYLFIFSTILYNYFTAFLSSKKIFFKIVLFNVITQLIFLVWMIFQKKSTSANNNSLTIENLIALYTCLYIINGIIATVLAFWYNNEKIHLINPIKILNKDFVGYTFTVFTGNILQFFAYRMDIWLMDHFQSKHDVGIYSMSSKIAQLWWLLPQLVAMLLFPLTALEHKSVSEKKFRAIILYAIAGSVITAIAAIFIFPIFINLTAGEAYSASYQPFLFLLPGVVVFSVNILLAARLAGKGNVLINMQGSALCFIIILAFDLWLIPKKSGTGAAIASSIGYSIATLFVIFKYRKWTNS